MKLKEDIILWKQEVAKLKEQTKVFESNSDKLYLEVKELKEQVNNLAEITAEMTEAMLTLIRQQLED